MDPRHAPRGPGAVRPLPAHPAPPGPGRRHDRRRGGRARRRAPGRPAAPAADPALRCAGTLGSGLKITGLGLDAALCGATAEPASCDGRRADTMALARMLYALLTGYWPGDEAPGTPPRCRRRPGTRAACARRGRSAPGCPPCWTPSPTARCSGQAADAPLRAQTPAGLAMALRMVQRPSYQLEPEDEAVQARPPRRTGASTGGMRGTPGSPSGPDHAAAPRGVRTAALTPGPRPARTPAGPRLRAATPRSPRCVPSVFTRA